MGDVITVICAVLGLGLGALGGYRAGSVFSARRARFWTAVALLFALCIGAAAWALARDATWIAGGSVGVLTGGLTGLKYGSDKELRKLLNPRGR
jgi:hypothetical protein